MRILGISGSLRAGSLNRELSASRRRSSRGVELVVYEGSRRCRPTTRTSTTSSRTRSSGSRRRSPRPTPSSWRRPSSTGRSPASSRTGSTGSRGRWPRTDPVEARGGHRREHELVRGDLGAARAQEGPRDHGRARPRRRAGRPQGARTARRARLRAPRAAPRGWRGPLGAAAAHWRRSTPDRARALARARCARLAWCARRCSLPTSPR